MPKYLLFLSLFFGLLSSASGGIIRVPQDQPGIQAGINAAFPGDTVLVADSTYYENIDFKGKAITVASYFLVDSDSVHIDSTIINGSQPAHPDSGSVVNFVSGEDTTSVLYGFTITGGTGTFYEPYSARVGGGIFCDNSGCKVLVNKIITNKATGPKAYGGGLAAMPFGSTAYVVLRDNQVTHNTITATADAALGGGIVLWSNGILINNHISFNSIVHNSTNTQASSGGLECFCPNVIIESNRITHNSVVSLSTVSPSALAGGVAILGSQGRFTKNEVSHNELWVKSDQNASGAGMLIEVVHESFLVDGNIIRENNVTQGIGWGGGINIANSMPRLINNIIAGNSATNGGGILISGENSSLEIVNNTIINNLATSGGGISILSAAGYVMNTIVWGNQAPTHPGIHVEYGSIHVAYSDIQDGWTGEGNINDDPSLDADTLLNDSPCIGVGTHSFGFNGGMVCLCPATDINGRSRPYPSGSKPDMGAWESLLGPNGIESLPTVTIPQEYSLSQNYPNPFNPSTTIEFALPKSAFVTLKVYNLLGEEVTTLASENLSAGKYKYLWDASRMTCPVTRRAGMASGVYFYRLHAGEYKQTKKLILMK